MSLSFSDHEMLEFWILRTGRRVKSKFIILDFQRPDAGLFKDLLGKVSRDKTPEGRGRRERKLVNTQMWSSPSSREFHPNKCKVRQKCQWTSKELLTKLKQKKKAYTM